MKQNKYAPIVSDVINRKTFDYKKGAISLNFTLRVDREEELLAFLACMEQATKDIKESLSELKIVKQK